MLSKEEVSNMKAKKKRQLWEVYKMNLIQQSRLIDLHLVLWTILTLCLCVD